MKTAKFVLTAMAIMLGSMPVMAADEKPLDEDLLFKQATAVFKPLPTVKEMLDKYQVSPEVIQLGHTLFFDKRLSRGGTVSCNSCHDLASSGVDNMQFSQGWKAKFGGRNSPTVLNSSLFIAQFWDGRAADVEEQAGGPVTNPVEMALQSEDRAVEIIRSIPGYQPLFDAAYGKAKDQSNITFENIRKAIGGFERTLLTPTPFDAYLKGDQNALTKEQKVGLRKFIDTGCISCHSGVGFGGGQFQKFGLVKSPYWQFTNSEKHDEGRFEVTKDEHDKFVFRVPGLRNVTKTYPYFHDGSVWSLHDAVDIMAQAQTGRKLADADIDSIVAFLGALEGQVPEAARMLPELPPSGENTPRPDNY